MPGNVLLIQGKAPTPIGAEGLNFRVRYGNGCDLFAIAHHRISLALSTTQAAICKPPYLVDPSMVLGKIEQVISLYRLYFFVFSLKIIFLWLMDTVSKVLLCCPGALLAVFVGLLAKPAHLLAVRQRLLAISQPLLAIRQGLLAYHVIFIKEHTKKHCWNQSNSASIVPGNVLLLQGEAPNYHRR